MNTKPNCGYMECTYFAENNKNIDFDHLNKLTYHADIINLTDITQYMHRDYVDSAFFVYSFYFYNYRS